MRSPCMGDMDPAMERYYQQYRRFPFIAYTEHHVALTLEVPLPPCNILPESLFPDPAPLQSILARTIDPQIRLDPLQHKLKITSAAAALLQSVFRPEKERTAMERAKEVLRVDRDQEPYPLRIRPMRPRLSIRAILETPQLGQMGSKPSYTTDLTNPASRHHVKFDFAPPEPFKEDLDENTILDLKPRFTSIQMTAIQEGKKRIMEGMQRAEERRGNTVAEAAIWKEWAAASDDAIRQMPRKLTPPLFPLTRRTFADTDTLAPLTLECAELGHSDSEVLATLAASVGVDAGSSGGEMIEAAENMGYLSEDTISGVDLQRLKSVTLNVASAPSPTVDRKNTSGGVTVWDRAITIERCQPIQPLLTTETLQTDQNALPTLYRSQSLSSAEAEWVQSGHWTGRNGEQESTTASNSRDLSAVEDMVTIGSGYRDPLVMPDIGKRGMNPQTRTRKRKDPVAAQELDDILRKKARYASNTVDIHKKRFDPAAHIREYVGAKEGLVIPSAILQPNRSGFEASPEPMPPSKPNWRTHPGIQNAAWYEQALRHPVSEARKIKNAMATIGLMHNRPLAAALEMEGFGCFEHDACTLSGVDLIISPSVGIILRPISVCADRSLLQDVQLAVRYFTRVYVIFEVKSYNVKLQSLDAIEDIDPLTPSILRSLPSVSREISAINTGDYRDPHRIGKVAVGYAVNGAMEVARVLSALAGTWPGLAPEESVLDHYWGTEEDELEHQLLINRFASRLILSRFSPLKDFIAQTAPDQIMQYLKPLVGKRIAERFVQMTKGPGQST